MVDYTAGLSAPPLGLFGHDGSHPSPGPAMAAALALVEPALPEPVVPAVIGRDGAVHAGPDPLRCLAGTVGPDALNWRTAPAGHRPAPPVGWTPAARLTPGPENYQT